LVKTVPPYLGSLRSSLNEQARKEKRNGEKGIAERREKDNVRAQNLFVSDEWARDKVYDETMRHTRRGEKRNRISLES